MTRSLDPLGLSRPEAAAESRMRERYRAALRERGLCAFCACREETFAVVHCRGKPERQRGMCQHDGRQPVFRLDEQTLMEFRDAA